MLRETNEKTGKKKNSSLEFYNDDMPRKAVGKLFNVMDDDLEPPVEAEPEPEEILEEEMDKDIVSGFDDGAKSDYYRAAEPRRGERISPQEERDSRYDRDRNRDRYRGEEYLDIPEKRREKYEFIEEADVRSGRSRRETNNNYDFDMYRKSEKKPAQARTASKKRPVYEEDYEEERPAKKYYGTAPVPVQGSRTRTKKHDSTEPIMRKSQSARFLDDDYADEVKESGLSRLLAQPGAMRIIGASVGVLFLIILAMLIIKLNIESSKVKAYEEQMADYNTMKESFSTLKIDYEASQEKVSELQRQLEAAENAGPAQGGSSGIDIDSPDGSSQAGSNGIIIPPSGSEATSQSGKRYTVKPGDTLMKIASEQMGGASKYQELMDANNLRSTDLTIGQELIIP